MKLDQYLKHNRLSLAVFAKSVGASPSTILRVRDGLVIPSRKTMAAIERATNGQVTATELLAVALAIEVRRDANDY